MKKKILSFAAVVAVSTTSFAADNLVSAFKEGKTSGQIRAGYMKVDYRTSDNDPYAFALGGKLGFETAPVYSISAGAVFYTTQDMGAKNNNSNKVLSSFYDDNGNSYSLLGQAYLQSQLGKTTIKIGRQQLDTPLAGSNDIRMIPNLFEAALVINSDVPSTTLIGGYVARMAGLDSSANNDNVRAATLYTGTPVNNYGNRYAATTTFQSMSRAALGNLADVHGTVLGYTTIDNPVGDKGVYVIGGISTPVKNLSLQAWEYYAVDLINALYGQVDYKIEFTQDAAIKFAAQGYKIENIGKMKDLLKSDAMNQLGYGKIDYYVYGVKVAVDTPIGLTPYAAYNKVSEQKDGRFGGTFVFGAWGGYPEFAISEEIRYNSFTTSSGLGNSLNGASVWKVGADYSLEKVGLGARLIGIAYTNFNLKDQYNLTSTGIRGQNMDTNVWDVKYTCKGALVKNLDATLLFESVDNKRDSYDAKTFKAMLNYNF